MATNEEFSSSPPEWAVAAVAALEPTFDPVEPDPRGSGGETTWRQTVTYPYHVQDGYNTAMRHATRFYNAISRHNNASTHTGTIITASLLVYYLIPAPDGQQQPATKIFSSTIPRGRVYNDITANGHDIWRSCCTYYEEIPQQGQGGSSKSGKSNKSGKSKGKSSKSSKPVEPEERALVLRQGPNLFHAEDSAMKMMDDFEASSGASQAGLMIMAVYGMQPPPRNMPNAERNSVNWSTPRQLWPCGPEEPYRKVTKKPPCQEVLDRRGIVWRFGIIPPRNVTPEPELPSYPPGYFEGGGGGGGGGGDYKPTEFSSWSLPTGYNTDDYLANAAQQGQQQYYQQQHYNTRKAASNKMPVQDNRNNAKHTLSNSLAHVSLSGGDPRLRSKAPASPGTKAAVKPPASAARTPQTLAKGTQRAGKPSAAVAQGTQTPAKRTQPAIKPTAVQPPAATARTPQTLANNTQQTGKPSAAVAQGTQTPARKTTHEPGIKLPTVRPSAAVAPGHQTLANKTTHTSAAKPRAAQPPVVGQTAAKGWVGPDIKIAAMLPAVVAPPTPA